MRRPPKCLLLLLAALLLPIACLPAAQLEVLQIPGVSLRDNPLGDAPDRPVALFSPDGSDAQAHLPLVIYLPGWGGSSQGAIADGAHSLMAQAVDALAARKLPLRLAVVDGRSRYGGSQYLNSTATGRYADYVTKDLYDELRRRFPGSGPCLIAGHSSGGYGALMLAMAEHEKFAAVVALSPDSDFEVTHLPLVREASVAAVTPAEVESAMAPPGKAQLPPDGLARLVLGLCANYTGDPAHPGRFLWLYDAKGQWRPEVWQRWIALDPLTAVRQHPDAFAPAQRIYLDGAAHDEYGANLGARQIYETLRTRSSPVTFDEPPGEHSAHLPERLTRGLAWVLKAP